MGQELVEKCGKSQARPPLGFISHPQSLGKAHRKVPSTPEEKRASKKRKHRLGSESRTQAPWPGRQRGERRRRHWRRQSQERGREEMLGFSISLAGQPLLLG